MTLNKYLLLQVPGWILGSFLLFLFWKWFGFSAWIAIGIFLVWVAKDFALYPFIHSACNTKVKTGVTQLIGSHGVARDHLDPQGYVQVGSELWQAETGPGHQPIEKGSPIEVQNTRGLTLVVTTIKDSR